MGEFFSLKRLLVGGVIIAGAVAILALTRKLGESTIDGTLVGFI